MRRRGLTITELLVVSAVSSLALFSAAEAMRQAKIRTGIAVCKAQMGSLYSATELYALDYKHWIPCVAAYRRTGGSVAQYCGRWSTNDPYRLYFAGLVAHDGYIEQPGELICAGTRVRNGWARAADTYAYLRSVPLTDWTDNPSQTVFGSYGLRWSGRKDKVYCDRRLMMAETLAAFPHSATQSDIVEMHGGSFASGPLNSGVDLNVVASDGSSRTLENYTDYTVWLWGDRYYYPHNERGGESFVTTYPWDSGPDYADLGWGFWYSFDQELFDAPRFPWGDTLDEKPADW